MPIVFEFLIPKVSMFCFHSHLQDKKKEVGNFKFFFKIILCPNFILSAAMPKMI